MKNLLIIFLLLNFGISKAQIIDYVYFLNEDNQITFFDSKTSSTYKIINVEVNCGELYKSSIELKHENDNWFINPRHAGTAYLKLTGEHRKKKMLKVLFMEMPQIVFLFEPDRNFKTIEDYHVREKEQPFLDSLTKWEKSYPDFELKSLVYLDLKNLPLEMFTKIDSAFVDLQFNDNTVVQNLKFSGAQLPYSLAHEIIKYPPAQLKLILKQVYMRIIILDISKSLKDITFDFKK